MTEYPNRLTEIIYKASGVNLATAERIAKKITEAGYRIPAGKAPLLTDEEIRHILIDAAPYDCNWEEITQGEMERYLIVSKAQNDADNKWYEDDNL